MRFKRIEMPDGYGPDQMEGLLRRHLEFPVSELRGTDGTREKSLSISKRLVAGAKRLVESAEKEKRKLTDEEGATFDYALRLADMHREAAETDDGRSAPFAGGGERSNESTRTDSRPALRFVTDDGKEIRGLRHDESIRDPQHDEPLPDGIRASELSIGRLVRACVTGDWSKAQAERRAMGESVDTLGGYLVPSGLAADIIDLARNQAVVLLAGGVTVPMNTNSLTIAKLTKDITAGWKMENQPQALDQNTFGKVVLNAKVLMGLASASVEVVEDAANLGDIVSNSIAQALALELDRAALRGDGTGSAPVGIKNTTGVQLIDLGVNGAQITNFDNWSTAAEKILTVNGVPRTTIYAPRTFGTMDRFKQATTNAPLPPPNSFAAMQKFVTNQIPINSTKGSSNLSSESYVGDFTQLLLGSRRDLVLEITRVGGDSAGGAFRSLQVWIRGYLRADVAIARPNNFCVIDGIIP